jgi:hypothetical protein
MRTSSESPTSCVRETSAGAGRMTLWTTTR